MNRPELLAPAGSPEALRAAVQSGADAVYLGYGQFHARVRASGFSEDEFREAVRYCHVYGVRVYLTLNTLLTDRELSAALEQARTASRLGVDAVLVQDWGLLWLLRDCLPDLPLHASTQMSIFTSGGVRVLRDAGCTRVVAARECSREDIAALCADGGAEIETFVHGALCMCYSGQCEMSAVIGGRSGNRGRCAQPCRLPCSVSTSAAFLKDDTPPSVALRRHLPPEGGDKSASTQQRGGDRSASTQQRGGDKNAADAYALSLKDMNMSAHLEELRNMGVACLKIEGRLKRPEYVAAVTSVYADLLRERRKPSAAETALLECAFSRSGFTDDYWNSHTGAHMFGTRSDTETRFREVDERKRKVTITCHCTIEAGTESRLTVSDTDGHCVSVSGQVPEAARNRPLTPESVSEQLRKTGATPYVCDTIQVDVGDELSLPVSALNALRREGLEALSACRTTVSERRECPAPQLPDNSSTAEIPRYTVSVCDPGQLVPELLELSPARVSIPLEWFGNGFVVPDWLRAADVELCAILPRVWRDRDEDALRDLLQRAPVTGVMVGNIGHLSLIEHTAAYGDFGLNVMNAYSAGWLARHGLQSVCVSFELRTGQIRDMRKPLPCEAIVYGRLPLMITENRPGGTDSGDTLTDCVGGTLTGHIVGTLTDRTGAAFPLLDAFGGRTEIQNSRPLWLADRDVWRNIGLSFARLRFTTESPAECVRVIRGYRDGLPADGAFTRGLYERGVE